MYRKQGESRDVRGAGRKDDFEVLRVCVQGVDGVRCRGGV